MKQKHILPLAVTLLGSAAIAAVPFMYLKFATGFFLPPVLPSLAADALYYLAGVHAVMLGHPFVGNPYIFEYANAWFPGLLLPLWIASVPSVLGFSLNQVFAIDAFAAHLVFGSLLFALVLRIIQGNRWLCVGITLLGVASLSNFLIRPAILQVTYAALIGFMMALFAVLHSPQKKIAYVGLGAMTTFAFYLYPHLWMLEFTVFGLLLLHACFKKDWKMLRMLVVTGAVILVACLPQIFNILSLFSDPVMIDLNARIGLVQSHTVLPVTIVNLKYLMLVIAGIGFIRTKRLLQPMELLVLLMSAGTVIAGLSNVITGKEMDFDTHPLWLGYATYIVAIAVFLKLFLHDRLPWVRRVALFLCVILSVTVIVRTFVRTQSFLYLAQANTIGPEHKKLQQQNRVFTFFNDSDIRNSVILAPEELADGLSLYTKNYLLYSQRAMLNTMTNDEVFERFLLQYADQINADFIRNEVESIVGLAPTRTALYKNAYGGSVQPVDLAGGETFVRKVLDAHTQVLGSYELLLKKYHVAYVITDALSKRSPRVPKGVKRIYVDERFAVYVITQK